MNYKYPLSTSSWGTEEIDAIKRVIDAGLFTMGSEVLEFETSFAEYIGSQHCVMVNSGSSANLLMIAALFYTQDESRKLEAGDEVIVPAVAWSTTFFPLYQYGLNIRFVDIDLDEAHQTTGFADQLFEQRPQLLARSAPGRPEIDDHRNRLRHLYDVGDEMSGIAVLDQPAAGGGLLPAIGWRKWVGVGHPRHGPVSQLLEGPFHHK